MHSCNANVLALPESLSECLRHTQTDRPSWTQIHTTRASKKTKNEKPASLLEVKVLRELNLDTIQLQKEQAPELACTLRRWVWLACLCLRDEAEGVTDLQAEEEPLHFQHHPHKQQSSINTRRRTTIAIATASLNIQTEGLNIFQHFCCV